jgi:NADP-dependent 3-hydroxy acid dehydrogenase YdfG
VLAVFASARRLARTSAEVALADRGEQELRGIAERLRLFTVTAR